MISLDELSAEERKEAERACEPLHRLLREGSQIESATEVEHSQLAIRVLDLLIDHGNRDDIWELLLNRWNNDNVLRKHGVGFRDIDSQAEFYIEKTRKVYNGQLTVHHQRIWLATHFAARLQDAKKQSTILNEIRQEVLAAQDALAIKPKSTNVINREDRLLSLRKLDKMQKAIESCQEKANLRAKAQALALQDDYLKSLDTWAAIIKLNVELSPEEFEKFLQAVSPLKSHVSDAVYGNLGTSATISFSKLAISLLDCLLIRTTIPFEGFLPALLHARWENDTALRELEQHSERKEQQGKDYVTKTREVFSRYSPADAERTRTILLFLNRVTDADFKQEQLKLLKIEIEEAIPNLTFEGSILRSQEALANVIVELEYL